MIEEETKATLAHEFQPLVTQPIEAASLDDASMNVVSLEAVREKYTAVMQANALLGADPKHFNSPQEQYEYVLDDARNRSSAFNRAEMLVYVAKHFAPTETAKQDVLAEAMQATKEIPQQEPLNAWLRQATMYADIFVESGKREHLGAAIKAAQCLPDPHVYNPEIHRPEEFHSQAFGLFCVNARLIERLDKLGGIE